MDVPALGKAAGRDGLLQVVHLVIVGGLCVFVIVYVCMYVCLYFVGSIGHLCTMRPFFLKVRKRMHARTHARGYMQQ